jgi:hypothetical protein
VSATRDPGAGQPEGEESATGGRPPVVRWLEEGTQLAGTGLVAATPRARRSSRLPLITVGLLALAVAQALVADLLDSTGPVPREFVGAWSTTAIPYADRGFVITSDSLWLRLGPEVSIAYPIAGVRKSRTADAVQYTFLYGDGSALLEMGLRMNPDSTVHLASLPSVRWRKERP